MKIWLDGGLQDIESARVSVFDHGLTVGDGIFETVKAVDGRPFALTRHLDRLTRSAHGLGLPDPDHDEVRRACAAVLAANPMPLGRLRITYTGGPGPLGSDRGEHGPTLVVALGETTRRPDCTAVVTVPWTRNERGALTGLKTTSYGENVIALAYAARRGAGAASASDAHAERGDGRDRAVLPIGRGDDHRNRRSPARIFDLDADRPIRSSHRDTRGAAPVHLCVLEKVREHAVQSTGIDQHIELVGGLHVDVAAVVRDHSATDELGEIDALELKVLGSRFSARELEELPQQSLEALNLSRKQIQGLRGARRQLTAPTFEHADRRDQSRERRPQLVTDIRREPSVSLDASFQRSDHRVEGRCQLGEVGIVLCLEAGLKVTGRNGSRCRTHHRERPQHAPTCPCSDDRSGDRRRRGGADQDVAQHRESIGELSE